MKNIYFISGQYYNFEDGRPTIGGVQTYVTELSKICLEIGLKVYIYVFDPAERKDLYNGCNIIGYNIIEDGKKRNDGVAKRVKSDMESEDDIVLVDTDTRVSLNVNFRHLVTIQHGICWDIPQLRNHSLTRMMLARGLSARATVKRLSMCEKVICVDYNFVNWYRALIEQPLTSLTVIPNFTHIPPQVEKPRNKINIIFARRLVEYRGTRVFTNAIKPILQEYPNVFVTIAGDGPDKKWMKDQLHKFENVEFISYSSSESAKVHEDKHIAVVPTVGSEGTSLSLLEAMASHCAVVCSDVGGMTNIVLDGYNGKIVSAGNVKELNSAIRFLIDDKIERERLADNGFNTVSYSFSYEIWRERWINVFKSYIKK